jgi:large subunit ribosomal protein L9
MKVLLFEDIKKLGWLGDVVDVADGYARNYLLPQGLAQVPTESNIRSIADEKAKRAQVRLQEKKKMEVAASAVEGAEAVIAAKANELGHLFGSISRAQIGENLRAQGFEVADEIIRIPEHIKEVGTSDVTLRFSADLEVQVKVTVVAENDGAEKANDESEEE